MRIESDFCSKETQRNRMYAFMKMFPVVKKCTEIDDNKILASLGPLVEARASAGNLDNNLRPPARSANFGTYSTAPYS